MQVDKKRTEQRWGRTGAELQEINNKSREVADQEGGTPKEIEGKENRSIFNWRLNHEKRQVAVKIQTPNKKFWTDEEKCEKPGDK